MGCSPPSPSSRPLPVLRGLAGPGSQEAAGASARSRFSRVATRCRQPSTYPGLCGAGGAGGCGTRARWARGPGGATLGRPGHTGAEPCGMLRYHSASPPSGTPHARSPEPTPGVLAAFPALQPRTVRPPFIPVALGTEQGWRRRVARVGAAGPGAPGRLSALPSAGAAPPVAPPLKPPAVPVPVWPRPAGGSVAARWVPGGDGGGPAGGPGGGGGRCGQGPHKAA